MKTKKVQDLMRLYIMAQTAFDANNVCMTVKECAEYLRVTSLTVLNHIKKGTIKATLIGRVWSIPKVQFLDEILKKNEEELLKL